MKILLEDFNRENLLNHIKHYPQFLKDDRISKEAKALDEAVTDFAREYNKIADNLAMSKAGKALSDSTIVGFMQTKRKACKYNKDTGDFVVYDIKSPRYKTITLFKKNNYKDYLNTYDDKFYSELPENQE